MIPTVSTISLESPRDTVLLDWNSNLFQHFTQDLSAIDQLFTFHNDWLNSAIFQIEVLDMNSEINPVCDPTGPIVVKQPV